MVRATKAEAGSKTNLVPDVLDCDVLSALNVLAARLPTIKSIDELTKLVVCEVVGGSGFENCIYYVMNATGDALKPAASIQNNVKTNIDTLEPVFLQNGGGEPSYASQTSSRKSEVDFFEQAREKACTGGKGSHICAPIVHHNRLLGTIDCWHQNDNFFNDQHLDFLTKIAVFTGATLSELRSYEQLTRQFHILNQIDEAMVIIGTTGRFIDCNAGATRMYGYSREELLQKGSTDIIRTPGGWHKHKNVIIDSLKKTGVWRGNVQIKTGQDKLLSVAFSVTNYFDKSGHLAGTVTIGRDISALLKSQQKLEAANKELQRREKQLRETICEKEAARRAQDTFIAAASHELRTPLNSIEGFSALLLKAQDSNLPAEKIVEFAGYINQASNQLTETIANILDISSASAFTEDVLIEPINITRQMEAIFGLVEHKAHNKSLRIVIEIGDDLPQVIFHPRQFIRVICNLLDNAIKFSPKRGVIQVSVSRCSVGVNITVRDHGPGIAPEAIKRVFEPFYTKDADARSNGKNVGLGLSLANQFSQANGAHMLVRSTLGSGASFTLVIPAS
ncbi:MAG: hypothetical protein COB37_10380 [Kordiimonadales bacterium]|nr:MAG: hypothetical protein COB37_10380 [Kordiimonadales bacterium]